ncbi:MAG TPA: acyltransferase, partial [Microthrixaceae bacterium]|nr:acyltransferase [Microthrixaceae bacterium]
MSESNEDVDSAARSRQSAQPDSYEFRRRIVAEPLKHVPALDGLRAVAVVGVMLYHARFGWITGGFLGVSAFFTLSGFLITSLLLREWSKSVKIDLRAFWGRRFRRLLPASWATMALVVAIGAFGGWNGDQLRALRGDIPFSLLEIVNWHFIWQDRSYGAGFVAPSPVEHFWSLAVEEQFYVILPVIVIGALLLGRGRVPRYRLRNLAIILGTLTVAGLVLNGLLSRSASTDRAYFGTDTRMAEMLIGSLLACLTLRELRLSNQFLRRLAGALGLVGLGVSFWLWHTAQVSATWMYPWGLLLCALCTAAIILGSLQGGLLSRALALPPLVWLGKVSYGVYLIHWPVFLLLTPARLGWSPWPLFALRAVVTLAAATLMFHF